MKVKELIEELKGACPEYEDLDVCFFNEHWLMDVEKVRIRGHSEDGETRLIILLEDNEF